MKIGYDIRSFLSNETGIGIYFKSIINKIINNNNKDDFFLFSSSLKERFPVSKISNLKNTLIKDFKIPVSIINYLWYRLRIIPFEFFFKTKIDIVHSPVPAIIPGKHKNIITVHDLCLFDKPELVNSDTIKNFKKDMLYSLKKADGIIAVSKFTKDRIIENFGNDYNNKIKVIYHGSDFNEIIMKKPKKELPDKYILFVGTIEPRKNIISILNSIDKIIEKENDLKLVICGNKGWESEGFYKILNELFRKKKVILFEYLNREELKYIYSKAKLLVFPSIYEGFGLPILEAAYSSLPVACSDIPVFNEIFEDFPVYFNPQSPNDITEKIINLLNDKNLYKRKKEKAGILMNKYTWDKAAIETFNFYKEVL